LIWFLKACVTEFYICCGIPSLLTTRKLTLNKVSQLKIGFHSEKKNSEKESGGFGDLFDCFAGRGVLHCFTKKAERIDGCFQHRCSRVSI